MSVEEIIEASVVIMFWVGIVATVVGAIMSIVGYGVTGQSFMPGLIVLWTGIALSGGGFLGLLVFG